MPDISRADEELHDLSQPEMEELDALGREIRGVYEQTGGSLMPIDPEKALMQKEAIAEMERNMESLTDMQRNVVKLYMSHDPETMKDMTFEKVGEIVGIRGATVREHYYKALRILRARLRNRGHLTDLSEFKQ